MKPTIPDSNGPNFLTNINDAISTMYADLGNHGQCRLVFVDASTLRLDRHNGRWLMIGGVPREIPSAGVTLPSAGLSATTMYYVYAYMNGSTMALEASQTGYATDTETGVVIRNNDSSKTLVGLIYCKTAATFADSSSQRFVASYFNRRSREVIGGFGGNRSASNVGTFAEVNGEARTEFLTWGDSVVQMAFTGAIWSGDAAYHTVWGVGIDSTTEAWGGRAYGFTYSTGAVPLGGGLCGTLSEGVHYATILAQVSATGSGTANSNTCHSESVMI